MSDTALNLLSWVLVAGIALIAFFWWIALRLDDLRREREREARGLGRDQP